MAKGGARPGAGRKVEAEEVRKNHTIKFSSREWETICEKAKALDLKPSEYIRRQAIAG